MIKILHKWIKLRQDKWEILNDRATAYAAERHTTKSIPNYIIEASNFYEASRPKPVEKQ